MSIVTKAKTLFNVVILSGFVLFSVANSQSIDVKIKVVSGKNPSIDVRGKILEAGGFDGRNWSFLQEYADAENLGSRISNFDLLDDSGKQVSFKKFANGEYVSKGKPSGFSWTVNAKPQARQTSNAHVSWVSSEYGLLMLNDLFPVFSGEESLASVYIDLPMGWRVFSRESEKDGTRFLVKDFQKAIFVIGKGLASSKKNLGKFEANLVSVGEWQFTDDEFHLMASEILETYSKLFGDIPIRKIQINLLNFPNKIKRGRWRAETRGANITILSSQSIAKSVARQRLHEQLRHEIFHLWIPNSLNLEGDYAWFYEGFAIYQALKSGVWLGQIGFDDYLNTIEQAYFITKKRRRKLSLMQTSRNRWNDDPTSVYAKGLLVAFLCDVAILQKTKGKRSLETVFRKAFRRFSSIERKIVANAEVLKLLAENSELLPIIEKYIRGANEINWANYLTAIGIQNEKNDTVPDLKVKKKLSRRQKALLKKLGYNRRRNFKRQKINRNVN